jgi:hypothetical protein
MLLRCEKKQERERERACTILGGYCVVGLNVCLLIIIIILSMVNFVQKILCCFKVILQHLVLLVLNLKLLKVEMVLDKLIFQQLFYPQLRQ